MPWNLRLSSSRMMMSPTRMLTPIDRDARQPILPSVRVKVKLYDRDLEVCECGNPSFDWWYCCHAGQFGKTDLLFFSSF